MRARCGDKGVVDLAGLIGYYSFGSVRLNVFEVPTPPGEAVERDLGASASSAIGLPLKSSRGELARAHQTLLLRGGMHPAQAAER
jgi:hypothetical protein